MDETEVKERAHRVVLAFAGAAHWQELIDELALNARILNRSEIIRRALVEKADRDLEPKWRERLGFDESEAA